MLQFTSDRLKNDKEVVLAAIKNDRLAMSYASDEIKDLCHKGNAARILTAAIRHENLENEIEQFIRKDSKKKIIKRKI